MSQQSELFNRFGNLQDAIWHSVAHAVSESAGHPVTFVQATIEQVAADVLLDELATPMVAVSFAFADQPASTQVIYATPEAFGAFASALQGEVIATIDESVIAAFQPSLEAVVRGICIAAETERGAPVAEGGVQVAFQMVDFPANLLGADWIGRCQAEFSVADQPFALTWLFDPATAGMFFVDAETVDATPFLQLEQGFDGNQPGASQEASSLDLIMDVPLEISVELGRVKMMVRDILELGSGAIIEIDKAAGEPVDVMVNGTLVARGEVVVIEDNFGVRITEIVSIERPARFGDAA